MCRDSGCGAEQNKDRHHSSVIQRENEENKLKSVIVSVSC